ncbi:hypothetical protein C8Q75DRAFT_15659 [Abortiporus biennis]|nr:hypothetical protein C8Q75DRAFT_15659 [Abortiporus biennis]
MCLTSRLFLCAGVSLGSGTWDVVCFSRADCLVSLAGGGVVSLLGRFLLCTGLAALFDFFS